MVADQTNNKIITTSPSSMAQNQNQNQNNNWVPLPCPRCESSNTKFCYYNNYSLTQPRHFCKACKRYWTRGGTLRNVPVGGGCRKNKRIKKSSPSASALSSAKSQMLSSSHTVVNRSDTNRNLDSFLFGLPPVAAPTYYDLQPDQLNQFRLGFDTNLQQYSGNFFNDYSSSSLSPYQNCMQMEREVKLEAGSINAIEPWQIPNYMMYPLESLAGAGDSSYWNSTAVGSAGWPASC